MAEIIYTGDGGLFKVCSRCEEAKTFDLFHRNKGSPDGLASACKACLKLSDVKGSPQTFMCERCEVDCTRTSKAKQRFCAECAVEVRRERDRARRPRAVIGFPYTCDRCACEFERKHGKQTVCPACVKFFNAARGQRWAEENRPRVRAAAKRYNDKKRATPQGHLEWTMRSAVKRALQNDTKGTLRTFDLLEYTLDELKVHLERQFVQGMAWENYGQWHIDHRVPLSSFKYETPDDPEFKAAWALTNLQPLWAADNLSKGAKQLVLV